MERPVKGEIVVLPFPFSDLARVKRRPALVLASADRGDVILAQITSSAYSSQLAIPLNETDFLTGTLSRSSFVRPEKLFTANSAILLYRAAALTPEATDRVIDSVIDVLRS